LEYDKCIENYREILDSLDEPFFDVCILSIGSDGHIASLFPNQEYLKHQEQTVIPTIATDDLPIPRRVSLSLETILSSRKLLVILKGDGKNKVLEEMLEGTKPAIDFPAKFLLAHPHLYIYTCFV
jgi:6-phosphogluconolactonase